MKRVDLADIGGADLAVVMAEQAEVQQAVRGAESEVRVYVLECMFHGEYGWTSVHRTVEGAQARLEEKVDEYGVRAAYEEGLAGPEIVAVAMAGESSAAGEDGDVVTWGISYLPVEE